jgi:hypothetical protein
MTTDRTSRRILTAVGAVVAALIVVAIVLAVRPPPVFDPTTPQGTAQRYYQAIQDGDEDAALGLLAEDLAERCDVYRLYPWFDRRSDTAISVVILATEVDDNGATVDVRVAETYGNEPFGRGTYRHDETLHMERSDGGWLIVGIPWPWDPYMCDEGG